MHPGNNSALLRRKLNLFFLRKDTDAEGHLLSLVNFRCGAQAAHGIVKHPLPVAPLRGIHLLSCLTEPHQPLQVLFIGHQSQLCHQLGNGRKIAALQHLRQSQGCTLIEAFANAAHIRQQDRIPRCLRQQTLQKGETLLIMPGRGCFIIAAIKSASKGRSLCRHLKLCRLRSFLRSRYRLSFFWFRRHGSNSV